MKIILNNKCHFTKEEFLHYQEQLAQIKTKHPLVLCPTYLYLPLMEILEISLGSQDVSSQEMGSYTGDVSAQQLKSLDVSYCIVGHSERRKNYQETNENINEKINRLFENDITPILCIGETKEERINGCTFEKIDKELEILKNRQEEEQKQIIIAYEPIWSIGTGQIPTVLEIDEVLSYIKKQYPETMLLYGGSVTEENINTLKGSQYIEGYLLGGLSLNPEKLQVFLEALEN